MLRRKVWIHGPTIFWAIVIFVISSIPSLKQPDIGFILQDKLLHLVEFGIMGFLLQRSFSYDRKAQFSTYLIVFIIGCSYGALDEIHQSFIEGRQSSFGDFFADSVGILLSQALFCLKNRFVILNR